MLELEILIVEPSYSLEVEDRAALSTGVALTEPLDGEPNPSIEWTRQKAARR